MKKDEDATPWRTRKARWSIPDLAQAIKLQCQACNQEDRFLDSNDCVSPSCPLFPFRPGVCRLEVAGVRRAVRQSRARTGNATNLRNKPRMTSPACEIDAGAGEHPHIPANTSRMTRS